MTKRAGLAAPAVAVTGALAATPALAATSQAPQPHLALVPPRSSAPPVKTHVDATVRPISKKVRTYTVQTGDTLAAIAQRFWGNASAWPKLYEANRSKISNPDLIYTGQVLVIPGRHASSSDDLDAVDTGDVSSSASTSSSSASSPSSSSSASSGSSSGSSVTAEVETDVASGNNLLAIGQFLVANGYSKAAAAGIASCIDGESLGNPESVGDGGGGLIGWTPLSSAQPNADVITGNVEQDMLTQLSDILYYNSTEIGASYVTELNSLSDPVAAADFYSQHFEKPAVTDGDVQPSAAEQVFSELGG